MKDEELKDKIEDQPVENSEETVEKSDEEPAKTEEKPAKVETKLTKIDYDKKEEKPAEKKSSTSNNGVLVIAILALMTGVIALSMLFVQYFVPSISSPVTLYNNDGNNNITFEEGAPIADVAAAVSPSVVSIVTETRTTSWYGSYDSSAAGTGFIVTADGFVVTNKHVVEGARTINIIMDNGTEYKNVKLIGTDPLNDVAVLKIDGVSDLKAVKLGDSKTLRAGQQVIAIGNALGQYQNTVTAGIISGTGRSLTAADSTGSTYENLSDMIQTDAAINGGNSGGPLVNAAGEVIGINTAYASDSQSIGFAIPITGVKGLIRDAIKEGKIQRAVLGVRYYSLDAAKAKELDLGVESGAYLYTSNSSSAIISGGSAEIAGLKDGDVIVAINDTYIGPAGSLSTLVGEYSVGDTVKLTVVRNKQAFEVNATLTAYK
ncbi:MAG: trypsin-like peptidase domain-containing protein [Candidatus Saccharibacteria bacterium]|nr:trypsin-like peptidase domain-containing protein [Candidatus Saccharibacteria bacterium]